MITTDYHMITTDYYDVMTIWSFACKVVWSDEEEVELQSSHERWEGRKSSFIEIRLIILGRGGMILLSAANEDSHPEFPGGWTRNAPDPGVAGARLLLANMGLILPSTSPTPSWTRTS